MHLKWGSKDFWELTDQVQYDWSDLICSNKDRYNQPKPSGEHWCICMWATESLINQVQCENVHFQCSATDVNYILGKYHDTDVHGEKVEITNAKCCMLNKCRDYVTDSTMAMIESEGLKCT